MAAPLWKGYIAFGLMNYAAIARVTVHQRERAVIIRPYNGGLALHTVYYRNEIHTAKGFEQNNFKDLKKQEIALGRQFAKT